MMVNLTMTPPGCFERFKRNRQDLRQNRLHHFNTMPPSRHQFAKRNLSEGTQGVGHIIVEIGGSETTTVHFPIVTYRFVDRTLRPKTTMHIWRYLSEYCQIKVVYFLC